MLLQEDREKQTMTASGTTYLLLQISTAAAAVLTAGGRNRTDYCCLLLPVAEGAVYRRS